tara:strand:+ start:1185 stop:1799 length:615 start_codon:yes stop_codon:yes gene_type:complete
MIKIEINISNKTIYFTLTIIGLILISALAYANSLQSHPTIEIDWNNPIPDDVTINGLLTVTGGLSLPGGISIQSSGSNVCLADGTNCPTTKDTNIDWSNTVSNINNLQIGDSTLKRIKASVQHEVQYGIGSGRTKDTVVCPSGYKLIFWGVEAHAASVTHQYSYCICEGDVNTGALSAIYLNDRPTGQDSPNYGCRCSGLCLKK